MAIISYVPCLIDLSISILFRGVVQSYPTWLYVLEYSSFSVRFSEWVHSIFPKLLQSEYTSHALVA